MAYSTDMLSAIRHRLFSSVARRTTLHERHTKRTACWGNPAGSSVIGRSGMETESRCGTIATSLRGLGGKFGKPKGVEVLVEPSTVHQFGMGAGFNEAPFVEDEDAIGSLDGRQAVGDHEGRTAFHE